MASDLDPTYGAMFIGLLFATFFQGVLTVQVYQYYENFPIDSRRLKFLVAVVWILDLAHLVLISQATYHYLVSNWGNSEALLYSTWELDLHLIFIGVATILCQSFFLHRVWMFSQKNAFIIAFLVAGCLVPLVLGSFLTVIIIRGDKSVALFNAFGKGIIAVFSIGAGVDVILACLLCYYLQKNSTPFPFERTRSLISKLIQYTVATSMATSFVAVACLVAYLIRPNSFIFIAIHFSLGRMYTNALLATLNSRQQLREYFTDGSWPPVFAAGLRPLENDLQDFTRATNGHTHSEQYTMAETPVIKNQEVRSKTAPAETR